MEMAPGAIPTQYPIIIHKVQCVVCMYNLLYTVQSGKIHYLPAYNMCDQNYQAENYLKVIKIFIAKTVT